MTFRQFVLVTHRWMGLASSLVLAIAGFTGTLLVWPEAIPEVEVVGGWHENLGAGRPGWFVVLAATAAGLALQSGGLVLWWKTRRLRVRTDAGLWRWSYDFHGASGVIAFVLMLVIGTSALGRVALRQIDSPLISQSVRGAVSRLHTTRDFPAAVKVVYAIASLGFLTQGLTGIVIWWKPTSGGRGGQP